MSNGESSYRRFLDGDAGAFDEIWKEYRSSLTFFIYRYVRDYDTAEDIAVDVFAYLLVHPKRYHFRSSLKTYLFMLGRSRALDWIRHRNVLPMTDLSEGDAVVSEDPVEEFFRKERIAAVNRALEQLPREMQIAVHLVYFEDLSYEDAARIMKKNKKQIDNLLYRAKKDLRTVLGKEGM